MLHATLTSIFGQSFADFEVIVVDDGSTDETARVIAEHGSRLAFYRQQNSGPGAARNLGVARANGKYLAFLDSDDLWFPWSLASYEEAIRKHGSPAFVAGKPLLFRDARKLINATDTSLTTESFSDYLASGDEWRWWGVSSFVIRADAFRATGGFATGQVNAEDADLALKLGTSGGFVQVVSPPTFAYREHGGGATLDVDKSVAGAWVLIESERQGRYPGGGVRRRERRQILTRHLRPISVGCARTGRRRQGWEIYRATFAWNFALGRLRYLLGFPVVAFGARPKGRRL